MIMSSTVWVDAFGNTRITLVRSDAGVGAILAAAELLCNAQPLECWEGPQTLYSPAPTSGQYGNAAVVARLTFLCGDGTEAVLKLFAPLASIFLADQATVDISNADVASLIAACIGHLESATGSTAVSFLSGSIGPSPTPGG